MKDLIIQSYATVQGNAVEQNGNRFVIKPVIAGADIDTCDAAFVEVPVGNYAFGYHYHDQKEEIFYIVSGKGELRHSAGKKEVKSGDMLCFPAGEKGAHVLSNTGSEPLIFIDFGVHLGKTDIAILPDIHMAILKGAHIDAMVELSK